MHILYAYIKIKIMEKSLIYFEIFIYECLAYNSQYYVSEIYLHENM